MTLSVTSPAAAPTRREDHTILCREKLCTERTNRQQTWHISRTLPRACHPRDNHPKAARRCHPLGLALARRRCLRFHARMRESNPSAARAAGHTSHLPRYDFQGDSGQNELSFFAGDTVYITNQVNAAPDPPPPHSPPCLHTLAPESPRATRAIRPTSQHAVLTPGPMVPPGCRRWVVGGHSWPGRAAGADPGELC